MEPFRFHVFVCTQEKPEGATSCSAGGSLGVLQALQRETGANNLDAEVQLTTCGCLGLCDEGPILVVYPEGVWYRKVRPEDVPEIVSSHLSRSKLVSRLAWTDARAMKTTIIEHGEQYRAALRAREQSGTLPDDLNELIRGFMPSRAVLTALELDAFTAVGAGGSAAEVANRIHADPRATEMLLNVLVSLKLLEKRDGTFLNTPASARFFVQGSPYNARGALLHTVHLWHRWSTMTDCVRAGTAVHKRHRDESETVAFIAAMDRNARERAEAVVKALGGADIHRMLDPGGGSGALSIAFARAIPGLRVEIMDTAAVVPLTREYIRHAGLADRIDVRVGDMLHDPLGQNYDLVLLSAICHMFSPEENRSLFKRTHDALAPKGTLIVQDFILEANKTAPRFAALFSLNMLVGTSSGSSYSEPEYAAWLQDAGFSGTQRVHLPGPAHLMIATRN